MRYTDRIEEGTEIGCWSGLKRQGKLKEFGYSRNEAKKSLMGTLWHRDKAYKLWLAYLVNLKFKDPYLIRDPLDQRIS